MGVCPVIVCILSSSTQWTLLPATTLPACFPLNLGQPALLSCLPPLVPEENLILCITVYWATVCKMVHPLSVCQSVCLYVKLVYCGLLWPNGWMH